MTNPITAGARAAANRLDAEFGPGLPSEVEAVLLDTESGEQSERYLDPISLASLIVSLASLAWNIYSDKRKKTPEPAHEDIVLAVRTELHSPENAGPVLQDKIIEVVVTEVTRAARKSP
jgi:hypothetical protein